MQDEESIFSKIHYNIIKSKYLKQCKKFNISLDFLDYLLSRRMDKEEYSTILKLILKSRNSEKFKKNKELSSSQRELLANVDILKSKIATLGSIEGKNY